MPQGCLRLWPYRETTEKKPAVYDSRFFIFLYYWTISYTKKIFLKLDSNCSNKSYKEKVTYNFYDDKLEIIRKYDRIIVEWKNITCCNIKRNLCWLGYGNKGIVINGDEFSFGTEEQFITFIKNKNHININLL